MLLLPHSFEGMGPETFSARLERFLQLAAKDNIQVANLTTPAQLFHACGAKCCVCGANRGADDTEEFAASSNCVSNLDELARGQFYRILPDVAPAGQTAVDRILICSGKNLLRARTKTPRIAPR